MPKVSVIIPVYGVEKYIERCARSLFEQTLKDMEFIFVDDYTKDNSVGLLQSVMSHYPERKQQVIILHHRENKGLPQARKTGVLAAKGDFIVHCDSDDWVDHDMYRSMYERAMEEKADVVVCDYMVTDGQGSERRVKACHSTDHDQFLENQLFQRDPWSLCNKLFSRTAYYKDLVFPKGNMAEDMALCSQLMLHCRRVAYVERPLYYYYSNPDSITKKLSTAAILRNFQAVKDNTDIVLSVYGNSENKRIREGLLYIQYNAKAHLFPIVHRHEYRGLFQNTYPSLFQKMLFQLAIPLKCKLKYVWALAGLYPRKIND